MTSELSQGWEKAAAVNTTNQPSIVCRRFFRPRSQHSTPSFRTQRSEVRNLETHIINNKPLTTNN
jgi:hypothetical protein